MSLKVIVSNSSERLAEHFRDEIYRQRRLTGGDGLDTLFTKEVVVVQSQGMSVWLNQQLADPIAANIETPFLNSFADSVLREYFPEDEKPLMTEDWMFWRIFRLLLSDSSLDQELCRYVQGENRVLKACQLAEKIAEVFDKYQIYHWELLKGWRESEKDGRWQARLYRALTREAVSRDLRFTGFVPEKGRQPDRITVFGVNSLSPIYFEFFRKLGEVSEVRLYYLNPSLEYWGENESRKAVLRRNAQLLREGKDPDTDMVGNPLLTSLGRQGRDFFCCLASQEKEPEGERIWQHYVPGGDWQEDPNYRYQYADFTLLSALQEDILLNIYRKSDSPDMEPASGLPLAPGGDVPDDSIVINSCHGELRQVEVLYDQLLRLLEDVSLEPRDILVMAPDISVYEPYIHAVFGSGESKLRNQYTIADRSLRKQNVCADTLLKVMQLLNGKFEVTEVLSLFENPELAKRWNFSRQNLEDIRNWMHALKIRWGIDAEHHEKESGVRFEEFSWESALDRLILGCATAAEPDSDKIEDVYPFDAAEGMNSRTAGNLAAFMHQLIGFQKKMTVGHTLGEWSVMIGELMDLLFRSCPRNYRELTAIRETLKIWKEQGESELWKDWNEMDLRLAVYLLEKMLLPTVGRELFLRGKITFCSLMPMRSIPMKVIAILGLEEQNFPRKDLNSAFNVKTPAEQRAALVHSRSTEDRYIFLEALLAAKEHFLLFYQGQDKFTGKAIMPAVPVKELTDTLNATFPAWRDKFIRKQYLRNHDPVYFQGKPGYWSYSKNNYAAAQVHCGPMPEVRSLLPEIEAEVPEKITPDQLIGFFLNPCEYYLKNVLCLEWSDDYEIVLKDSEAITPDKWERFRLLRELLRRLREKPDLPDDEEQRSRCSDFLRKTNMLAPQHQGEVELSESYSLIQSIPKEFLAETAGKPVSIQIGGTAIEGEIEVNKEDRRLYVLSDLSGKNEKMLGFYLKHLILCAADGLREQGQPAVMPASHLCIFDTTADRSYLDPLPPDEAGRRLEKLMGYFCLGHRRPLAFFLNAAAKQVGRQNKDDLFGSGAKTEFEKSDLGNPAVRIFFEPESAEQKDVYEEFTCLSNLLFGFSKRGGELKNV